MGRKYCVANCKGNCDEQTKVKGYRLPRNSEEKKKMAHYSGTNAESLKKVGALCRRPWLTNEKKFRF